MASTRHLKGISRSLGETFISRNNDLAGYCAPHDPSIESRSTRANALPRRGVLADEINTAGQ